MKPDERLAQLADELARGEIYEAEIRGSQSEHVLGLCEGALGPMSPVA